MKQAFIRIERDERAALDRVRQDFLKAVSSGEEQGAHFSFESPAALFRVLTPKRWELIEKLQAAGPTGVRALARLLERDVRRVHDDARALIEFGLVEKTPDGKLRVPFERIHAEFDMAAAA
jgi:predicted transcriptional regulator